MTDKLKTFILSVNGGSSSLKFSLYHAYSDNLSIAGSINRIGEEDGQLEIKDGSGKTIEKKATRHGDFNAAVNDVVAWLKTKHDQFPLLAIGHRLVQGGPNHRKPEVITDGLLKELTGLIYLAPNHLPEEIKTIQTFQSAYPDLKQIACFDTSFHHSMPSYAKNYPVPKAFKDKGLIKYGFHGLSYEYIMQELAKENVAVAEKKIIIAHLGNGASMAAVKHGIGVDTTMGVSPIGGLVMGTRSGDLDPGVLLFMLKQGNLQPDELEDILSKHSGLQAIAGISDVQELLKNEDKDPKAKEAIAVFCYNARKFIGALTAAMDGLDLLVFTGGIGENAAVIRQRICDGLSFMGITINDDNNDKNETVISAKQSKIMVRVIKTNEELMIARLANKTLDLTVKQKN